MARYFRQERKSIRMWLVVFTMTAIGTVLGCIFGEATYFENILKHYTYEDMASYTNIDPSGDQGGAFMDAGRVYFKEGTYVPDYRALAFKNMDTYCIAPIIRQPLDSSVEASATISGFTLPPSGTIDWWAVGTNCCGEDGNSFTCGSVANAKARSGLRLLDETAQKNYLIAVQEWVGTTGLPARHPLFFTWTVDPYSDMKDLYTNAWSSFWRTLMLYSICAVFGTFFFMVFFQYVKVY